MRNAAISLVLAAVIFRCDLILLLLTVGLSWLVTRQLTVGRALRIGFVFQNFNLLPRFSALENVMLPLLYGRTPRSTIKTQALQMLTRVGLADRLEHLPTQLSGGQRQRVAIARALVADPAILLADEPTGALDSNTGREIMALFAELHDEGRTLILVTHDAQVAGHAQRVIRLHDGRVTG